MATTIGTTGATFALTEETGGMVQVFNCTQRSDKEETRDHTGIKKRITYYNLETDVEIEIVSTGSTGISAAAIGTALTVANTAPGTGLVIPEQIQTNRTNTTEKRIRVQAVKYEGITA